MILLTPFLLTLVGLILAIHIAAVSSIINGDWILGFLFSACALAMDGVIIGEF